MPPNEIPVVMQEEVEEEESSDDDNDSLNCVNEEIKDDLDSAITAIFEENRDRVTIERFRFILQMVLTDPAFEKHLQQQRKFAGSYNKSLNKLYILVTLSWIEREVINGPYYNAFQCCEHYASIAICC